MCPGEMEIFTPFQHLARKCLTTYGGGLSNQISIRLELSDLARDRH